LLLDGESRGRRVATADRRRLNAAFPPQAYANCRAGADRRRALDSTIADGVGFYWRYEKGLRRLESSVGSTLGATGAIYAMRRSLWVPLPPDTILDDVLAPMHAVLAGYRTVFNEKARAFDRVAPDADTEARRKIRTLAGNYQILWLEPRLLLPWRNPVWLQYMSHKIGRLVVPYALLTLVASSMAVADRSIVFAAALAVQCAFYLLAGYGAWLDLRGTIASSRVAPAISVTWRSVRRPERPGAVNV
jgi:cellulose synthase/poly-beta-1,6-N-acetylglucosamine synthase-like glycosyltransferase